MTELLVSAPVIATSSLEEAREAVGRIFLRHDLAGRDGAMNVRFNAVADRHMTLGYLTYQADAELTMPATEDCYIVNLTVEGQTRASRGDGVPDLTGTPARVAQLSDRRLC